MNTNVTFRHMDSSPALRDYAVGKLERVVTKYVHGKVDADIVMSVEKIRHIANFTINIKNLTVKGESRSEDMYSSIDIALDKIERQLRRHKDRLRDHKPTHGQGKSFRMSVLAPPQEEQEEELAAGLTDADEYETDYTAAAASEAAVTLEAPESAEPKAEADSNNLGTFATSSGDDVAVIRQQDYEARAMRLDEAVIQLDLMEERQFFVFTNADSKHINIVYKRADGKFGLIET
jgi:putative sigma-54 modulation protein